MPNSDNIQTARPQTGGAVYIAVAGTTAPTDASTSLAAAYKSIGHIHEDGISLTVNETGRDIKNFGGDVVLSISQDKSVEVKFKPLEWLDENAQKLIFDAANVTISSSKLTGATIKGGTRDEWVMVFEIALRDGKKMRIVLPRAQATAAGSIDMKNGDPVCSEVTAKALASGTNGDELAHIYYAYPQA